jgi:hypothetical protein
MALQKDFKEFIELLIEKNVDFLIVGAHAVAFHGFPRLTGDIDFFFSMEEDNVKNLVSALHDFGFPFTINDLLKPNKVFQMGVPPNRIDLLNWLSGVNFQEAWSQKVAGEIDGLSVYYISKTHLIENKKASGRPKDLIDLEILLNN